MTASAFRFSPLRRAARVRAVPFGVAVGVVVPILLVVVPDGQERMM
jgi:hypothetical protein